MRALASAGYLKVTGDDGTGSGPSFSMSDLKGFVARNADGGSAILVPDDADPAELLEALEGRSAEMARRALDIFRQAMPEASIWTADEQRRFVEQSSDGIYELDVTGRLSYANPSLAAMVGQSPLELEGARLEHMFQVVDDRGAEALARLDAAGSKQGGAAEVTFEALRADGVRREFHVVTFPRTADGEVVGYQGVVQDVTAVREAQRARNEFLAMVTQDLRSPITTILGLGVTLEAYADELSVERIRRTGASIRRQAERISRVADDLYEVARLETHSLRLTLRPTDVAGAIDAALTALEDPSGVEVDVPEGLEVQADGRRLELVVASLVENAITHGDPPVVVEAWEEPDGIDLVVTDAGPGVPAEAVPTLFTRPGSGIGLYLARGLAEAMGGRVAYEPGPGGRGSTFRVHLRRASGSRSHG